MGSGLAILEQVSPHLDGHKVDGKSAGVALAIAAIAFKEGIGGIVEAGLNTLFLNDPPQITSYGAALGESLSNNTSTAKALAGVALDTDDAPTIIGGAVIGSFTRGKGLSGVATNVASEFISNSIKDTINALMSERAEKAMSVASHKEAVDKESVVTTINEAIDSAIAESNTIASDAQMQLTQNVANQNVNAANMSQALSEAGMAMGSR